MSNNNRWGCFPELCFMPCCVACCVPGPQGPQGIQGPEGPSGLLNNAFISARLTMPIKINNSAPIPFPQVGVNKEITLCPPFTTFRFEEKGNYLLNFSFTGNVNHIRTVVADCEGPETTNYTFSPNVESKSFTAIIPVTKKHTTLQLLNCSMIPCAEIFSAYITIVKIAEN